MREINIIQTHVSTISEFCTVEYPPALYASNKDNALKGLLGTAMLNSSPLMKLFRNVTYVRTKDLELTGGARLEREDGASPYQLS